MSSSDPDTKILKIDTSIKTKLTSGLNIFKFILISIVFSGVSLFIFNINNSKNNAFVISGNFLIFIPSYVFLLLIYFNNDTLNRNDYITIFLLIGISIFALVISFQKKDVKKLKDVKEDGKIVKKLVNAKELLDINIYLSLILFIIFIFILIILFLTIFKLI